MKDKEQRAEDRAKRTGRLAWMQSKRYPVGPAIKEDHRKVVFFYDESSGRNTENRRRDTEDGIQKTEAASVLCCLLSVVCPLLSVVCPLSSAVCLYRHRSSKKATDMRANIDPELFEGLKR